MLFLTTKSLIEEDISRDRFPGDFTFGCSTAAYQIEGGVHEGRILDGSTGNIACDSYHKYQEDVDLINVVGFDAYRFSIAWTLIFPDGVGNQPNPEGLA
ncbi:hypothetical protein R1sor_026135 [Riccia sorocarpa]|uniref:Beta-glucosidase n=1 Tax=Riccia sorocarpa TaxID=122646 RepID=A0ABD3GAK3_9MARC